jgi:thiamine-phosphate pyrophosphorylase
MEEHEQRAVLRILDANANRCAEGIRVIEEIARFIMESESLTRRLKGIRHEVRSCMDRFTGESYRFRDAREDVGGSFSTGAESYRGSMKEVARANFRRSEEALRVVEEFGKLIDPETAKDVKALRFELYSLEGTFFDGMGTKAELPTVPFLYAILDRSIIPQADVADAAASLVAGGADLIQYRAKGIAQNEQRADLLAILTTVQRRVPVLVNDDPMLAAETGAEGVHLGPDDADPEEARSLLGPNRIIGVTAHSIEEALAAPAGIIDYVAYGAVFASPTKPDIEAVTPQSLAELRDQLRLPLVAIGGITPENVRAVLDAGADGIAVVSSILIGDIRKNCFTFKEIIARRRDNER